MSDNEMNEVIVANERGKHKRTPGFFGGIGRVLYFIFIKNFRKKILSIFFAAIVLAYAYVISNKDKQSTGNVCINNVNVEFLLDNSEKYCMRGDFNAKVSVMGRIPDSEREKNDNPFLNSKNYVLKVKIRDEQIEDGFVRVHLENVVYIPPKQDDEKKKSPFDPRYFMKGDNKLRSMKIKLTPNDYDVLEERTLNVEIDFDTSDFSRNFNASGNVPAIRVKAPQRVFDKLKLKTRKISLKNRITSFYESVCFDALVDGLEKNELFDFNAKSMTLIWRGENISDPGDNNRMITANITISRFMIFELEYPVKGFLVDDLKQLNSVDVAKMKELKVNVKLQVDSSSTTSVSSDKFVIFCDLTKVSDNAVVGGKGYSCDVICKLNDTSLNAKVIDYSPKKVDIIFDEKKDNKANDGTADTAAKPAKDQKNESGDKSGLPIPL